MAFYTSLTLNGFKVELPEKFLAYKHPLPDNSLLAELREQYGHEWFLLWNEGIVWGLPRFAKAQMKFGTPVTLRSDDILGLRLLRARILDVLPEILNKEVLRRSPFIFLAQENLISKAMTDIRGLPPIVQEFAINPKLEFNAKIIELKTGETEIGIFLESGTRWSISASLEELQKMNVPLNGLDVVRREVEEGQRRLVGRIDYVQDGTVYLQDSYDDLESIESHMVTLEGSRRSFAHCLKVILGGLYQTFEEYRALKESKNLVGPGFDKLLNQCQRSLANKSPFTLGGGIFCSVTDRIDIEDVEPPIARKIAPVSYCFDAARTKQSDYPWQGLVSYGPYSRDSFALRSPTIWVFFPNTSQGAVENFVKQLRDGITQSANSGYPSRYAGGFAQIFGLTRANFELKPIRLFAQRVEETALIYRKAVEDQISQAGKYPPDCAIVVIPDNFPRTPNADNPYLQAKSILLMAGIPVQEVRVGTLSSKPYSLQYINQNISVALYAKMKGTPWTVNHDLTINDELVIGMGVCEIHESRFAEKQRLVGITTVFRGDGNYLLGNVSKDCNYSDYPKILRQSTIDILNEIKSRNGWQPGDTIRIVFHVYKPLRNVEVADIMRECVKTLENEHHIEFAFLTVSHDHPFFLFEHDQKGRTNKNGETKAQLVPERGTTIHLGKYTRLLCTQGPDLIKRSISPLPQPVLIHLHEQSTYNDLDYLTEQVLKFTSLSWRSTLPAAEPVTIYYSQLIAELLAKLKTIPDWSPSMLNLKLRYHRWFL